MRRLEESVVMVSPGRGSRWVWAIRSMLQPPTTTTSATCPSPLWAPPGIPLTRVDGGYGLNRPALRPIRLAAHSLYCDVLRREHFVL